jgi:hypothetical protein
MSIQSNVETKKQNTLSQAGSVTAAIIEWGNSLGNKMRVDLITQEQMVTALLKAWEDSQIALANLTTTVELDSKLLDGVLAGAVALAESDKLGEVPALTDFTEADRYTYADVLAAKLEGFGAHGEWLAKSVRMAKKRYLGNEKRLKEVTDETSTAQGRYEASVFRLSGLVAEAKALLKENLPANSPIFRHIKAKRAPRKPKQPENPPASGQGNNPSAPKAPTPAPTPSSGSSSGSTTPTNPTAPAAPPTSTTPSAPTAPANPTAPVSTPAN